MKPITLIAMTLVLLAGGAPRPASARGATLGVQVHGDSVTFRFRPSSFRMVVHGRTSQWQRLRELNIREVTVAGGWNQWSTVAWPLHPRNGEWVLTSPLSAVADHDTVSFKFVVNEEWWVQPPPDCPNQLNAGIGDTTMNMFFVRPGRP